MLKAIDKDLWIVQTELKALSTLVTMTVIRLKNGELLVISPIRLKPEDRAALDALGPVSMVISPNAFHHLFFLDFLRLYPAAKYYFSPILFKKIKDRLAHHYDHEPLSPDRASTFSDEVTPFLIDGMPNVMEYVFYHHESHTLIACDLLFFIRPPRSLPAKLFWACAGVSPKEPRQSRLFRFFTKDKAAYQRSIDRILKLEIKRIIVAHERVIEGADLKQALGCLAGKAS